MIVMVARLEGPEALLGPEGEAVQPFKTRAGCIKKMRQGALQGALKRYRLDFEGELVALGSRGERDFDRDIG